MWRFIRNWPISGRVPGGPGFGGGVKFAHHAGEQPGIHQDQGSQALDPLEGRAGALGTSPILTDDGEFAQVELVDQADQVGDVVGEGERRIDARMIGVAGSDPIGGDGAIAGVGEGLDEIAIEISPGRISR